METKQILTIAKIVSWIIFIGLCIKTGALIIAGGVSLFINQEGVKSLYLDLDLSQVHDYSRQYYLYVISFLIAIPALQAYLFYLVIKVFSKIDFDRPFSLDIANLTHKISYYALATGVVAIIARGYCKWLLKKNVDVPLDWGGSEFLFMAGILFVITLLFKRGAEIQAENDLTI